MDFDQAFERLMKNEGGVVSNPADPGGLTKFGISSRSYPGLDIASLTLADCRAIYKRDFWTAAGMDKIPGALAFQVFDAAVNHGISTAVRMMQRAAGVADDGHAGPVTIAAVNAKPVSEVLMLFLAERLLFWTALSTWPTFGKGWARRAATDLRYAAQDA